MDITYRLLFQWTVLVELPLLLTLYYTSTAAQEDCVEEENSLRTIAQFLNNIPFLPELNTTTLTAAENNSRGHIPSQRCPPGEGGRPIHHSSLCPWTTAHHVDNTRFPSIIFYARCLCSHCATDRNTSRYHYCRPLYHGHTVLKRHCTNGVARYVLTHESFPVACVCSHAEHVQV